MNSLASNLIRKTILAVKPPKSDFALQDSAVYGPIHSRRLGESLGINPLPVSYKFCDFDCVYCQYGWTPEKGSGEKLKKSSELLQEIREAFQYHQKIGTRVDCITIAGNGEPTIYPYFGELVDGLINLRNEIYPKAKIGILSDSSQAHRPEIYAALEKLDERYMKLDAGTPELIAEVNRPRGDFNYQRMLDTLRNMKEIVIQSLFMQGSHDNTKSADIDSWIKAVQYVKPAEIQVYTIDRKPADPGLKKVSDERLREIAELCESRTGIKSVVYD